jgi:hypothetical protein
MTLETKKSVFVELEILNQFSEDNTIKKLDVLNNDQFLMLY